jgi:alpha-L-fucosidase
MHLPTPTAAQLAFMGLEMSQFMHFGIPTYWDAPSDFLRSANPTFHDCHNTGIDHSNQTGGGYYPCLHPDVWNPTDLDADDWMASASALGTREICLTAQHEGGFALWPSKFTNYSVAASAWYRRQPGNKGDVLRQFADAANRWGIKICYYLNVQDNGYLVEVEKADADKMIARELGMLREVLAAYGPVHRFWFDGTSNLPGGVAKLDKLWRQVYQTVRSNSPATLVSSYRGDVCAAVGSLYTNGGPAPNSSSDITGCAKPAVENGSYFHPTEMHGITMQEGPDGNTDAKPTYWFWHPWACAGNTSGCPWVGHANASRIFDSYLMTVGHGAVLNLNSPPDRSGRMNASVAAVMYEAGRAINATFRETHAGKVSGQSAPCSDGVATLSPTGPFDYIVSMEELSHGQRIGNYSIDFRRPNSSNWEPLVPPVQPRPPSNESRMGLEDRPDGHDPRDQYVGHKRIDVPVVQTSGVGAVIIEQVRFNCIRLVHQAALTPESLVHLAQFSLHRRRVPWEEEPEEQDEHEDVRARGESEERAHAGRG